MRTFDDSEVELRSDTQSFAVDYPTESKDGDINPSFSMYTYVLRLTFHVLYKLIHIYYTIITPTLHIKSQRNSSCLY